MITAMQPAPEQVLVESQFNLGMGNFKRDEVPEGDSQAAVWFGKAAERVSIAHSSTAEQRSGFQDAAFTSFAAAGS